MKKVIIVLVLFGLNFSALGQKNILIEKFTNLYCGSCPDKSILIANLVEEYPQLIWISHYSPSHFEYNPLPFPDAEQMWQEVQISGTPNAIVDRIPYNNSLGTTSTTWETRIQQQVDLESYVDIEFSNIDYDTDSRQLTFDIISNFHAIPTAVESFRVYAYITEDNVIWRQHSYYNNTPGHPLEGLGDVIQDYSHPHVLRDILSGGWGAENIIPDNPVIGVDYVASFSYQIPEMYNHSNIELTAAVSQHDDSNFLNRPILNAERVLLKDFVISSIEEETLDQFNAFPNPTQGILNLQFKEQPTQIQLIDFTGKLIKQYVVDGLDAQIDLRNIPAGNYILQVLNGEKSFSQKIVIQ